MFTFEQACEIAARFEALAQADGTPIFLITMHSEQTASKGNGSVRRTLRIKLHSSAHSDEWRDNIDLLRDLRWRPLELSGIEVYGR